MEQTLDPHDSDTDAYINLDIQNNNKLFKTKSDFVFSICKLFLNFSHVNLSPAKFLLQSLKLSLNFQFNFTVECV